MSPCSPPSGSAPSAGPCTGPRIGRAWSLAIVAWTAFVVAGLWVAGDYAATAGTRGEAPIAWPSTASFSPSPGKKTLVMFAHPRCPCTRASLSELDRLMAAASDDVEAYVLIARPAALDAAWVETDLVAHARRIPRTRVVEDPGSLEAARFGAETSGHLFVYDERGTLELSGGLTAARGHEGQSLGRDDVLAVLSRRAPVTRTHEVFGCPIAAGPTASPRADGPTP